MQACTMRSSSTPVPTATLISGRERPFVHPGHSAQRLAAPTMPRDFCDIGLQRCYLFMQTPWEARHKIYGMWILKRDGFVPREENSDFSTSLVHESLASLSRESRVLLDMSQESSLNSPYVRSRCPSTCRLSTPVAARPSTVLARDWSWTGHTPHELRKSCNIWHSRLMDQGVCALRMSRPSATSLSCPSVADTYLE